MATVFRPPFVAPRPAETGLWLGVPTASLLLTVLATTTAVQPPTPFWEPKYEFEAPGWQGAPQAQPPIITALTSTTFFGAGGQAPTTEWRANYDTGAAWAWTPQSSSIALTASPFYGQRWRFDQIESAGWNGGPLSSAIIPLLTQGGKPFSNTWSSWYEAELPNWNGSPAKSAVLDLLTAGGEPFSNAWAASNIAEHPPWLGTPSKAATLGLLTIGGQSFVNNWPPLPVETQGWLGESIASYSLLITTEISQPFLNQWQPVPQGEAIGWLGAPLANDLLRSLTQAGQPPTKPWRYDFVEGPSWAWQAPAGTLIRALTATGQVGARQWRPDHLDFPAWSWGGGSSDGLRMLTAGGLPARNEWRYDCSSDASIWAWRPNALPITIPPSEPFFVQSWSFGILGASGDGALWAWSPQRSGALYPPTPPIIEISEWIIRARRRGRR